MWDGARAISLRPKAFAVLKLLIENSEQLVTKQHMLDVVWPGTFVTDAVLKDSIRQLRDALGDDAESPTYIETAHRRGYRFIASISSVLPAAEPSSSTPAGSTSDFSLTAELPPDSGPVAVLGRETELDRIRSWLNRALTGERQTVFVTGEAGIGKTTLVQALLKQASAIPGVLVLRGQCLEHYGAGEAYMPVLDALSRLGRSANGARVVEFMRHHAPSWLAQIPSLVPAAERESLQAQALGVTRERMLREMAEAVEIFTAETPLILVLEDLHWSDYSTLNLVSYLARRPGPARLMVIGTYRPVDVILGDHPLKTVKRELQAHALCHELPLEYLTEEAIAEYLRAKFPGHQFSGRLARMIHRRTEGNPLFMVNVVEYLIDEKLLVQDQGAWKIPVDLAEVELGVPESIKQLIEKQLERLSPDERAVLEGASVAGMECSSVAIAAGLDMSIETVEHHCEELARRHHFLSPGWLVELPDGTVTSRHRFIHILYLEVPYSLIPRMRRSQIHHRIAERGIAIYGDRSHEIATELAMHFEQSRDWPRALEYLLQAAVNAAARSAPHEAIDLANRGLDSLQFVPGTAEHAKQEMKLRMVLSVSLTAIKGFASPEVETINARGRELFRRQGPSPELFYMLWSLNLYHQFSGEMHLSLEISHQLIQLAEDLKDGALVMEAHRALGAALVLLGRCTESLEHLAQGTALSTTYHNHPNSVFSGFDSKVMFECFSAMALLALGFPDQSANKVARGLTLARELHHPQTLVVAGHVAAQLHQLRGEASLAYERAKEAMDLADEYGLEVWLTYGLIEVGWAEAELGEAQVGIARMQRGLAAHEATGAKLRAPYFLGLLADQLCKAGRVEEGLAAIARATALGEHTGESFALPELYRLKGELILKTQPIPLGYTASNSSTDSLIMAEAEACFAQAIAIAQQQQTRFWELKAHISMYRLHSQWGRPTHMQLATSYSSFTEGHETADLKQARALLNAVPQA
ncbi:MAG TPA: AAA family ATPase [Terriglobales bacterium]|nr:AAA family ATPase [Terriglobales bacterium]